MSLTAADLAQPAVLQVPWLRACELCDHGRTVVDGARRCCNPLVVQPEAWAPVELMRRPQGPCGLNAEHMETEWLHPGRRYTQ